jgi:hypothetical protein
MGNRNEISYEHEEQLSEEEMLRYLDEDITSEEKERIEKKAGPNSFEYDALQGLSQVTNKESVHSHVNHLNGKLRQLTFKKPRKHKEKIKVSEWLILAILILLFICVMGFIIISIHNNNFFQTNLDIRLEYLLGLL